MKNWIHFLDCSRTVCNFVQHRRASRSSLSLGPLSKMCHMYTYLCFGGVPTKTQAPFLLLLKKKNGSEESLFSVWAATWGHGLQRGREVGSESEECCVCREELGEVRKA